MKFKRTPIHKCPLCLAEKQERFIGYRLNCYQGLLPARSYAAAEKVVRCARCGVIYNNPQIRLEDPFNEDDSLLVFTQRQAEEIKAGPAYTDVLLFLKQKAKLPAGAKVLDIGTGIGRVAFALRRAGYDTYAIEPKKELFDFGILHGFTDKDKTFNLPFETAEFEAGSFDFIFLEPLNHFTEPHQAIQKALCWLKPGGYLQLEVVNSRWLYKLGLAFFYKLTFRKHVPYTLPLRKPFYACEYSVKALRTYCRLNNLQVCELTSHPCDTFIANKRLNSIMHYIMRRFNMGSDISVIVKKGGPAA